MRKVLLGMVASGLAFGILATASPVIDVDNQVYDFGIALESEVVYHVFTIRNMGDETLEIVDVSAPCGCTTTELITNALHPGDSILLEVRVATRVAPVFTKTVTVFSNDPATPELVLSVAGTVVAALEPYHVSAEDVRYDYTVVIDLRERDAYAAGHFLGAVNIPFGKLEGYLDCIPPDPLVVVYDETGALSDAALGTLADAGVGFARGLYGGLAEWAYRYGATYIVPHGLEAGPSRDLPAFDIHVHIPTYSLYSRFFVLVDLRDPAAFAEGHLIGAVNLEIAEIETWMSDLPRAVYAILYDQTGASSDGVADSLYVAGFSQVRSMFGGLDGWRRRYGEELIVPGEEWPFSDPCSETTA